MRNLKLESPRMTGADVEDWQTFLTLHANYRDVIDGVFGPNTARATRVYQTGAGLPVDGVVGPATFSRAVLDGFQSATRAIEAGLDASVDCTLFAAGIAAEGIRFVARYYSRVAAKTLNPAEAKALCAAGLRLVTVYQDSQNDVKFFSEAQGVAAAERALALAGAVGQPEDSAIYFAADFDPSPTEVRGPVVEYFQAVSQTFRSATTRYAIGVYGSGLTCRLIRDAGLAQFAWLSGSTGFRESMGFRPRAHLIQAAPSRKICGGKLAIDDDVAQTGEYGAFTV
ncbi:MAG TPA: glycoside hydrolase domain-containing protein [Paludibaculum sp.]|jgi:peptidoglycan hydrolase-like protein with peptidoglycan-binding domain